MGVKISTLDYLDPASVAPTAQAEAAVVYSGKTWRTPVAAGAGNSVIVSQAGFIVGQALYKTASGGLYALAAATDTTLGQAVGLVTAVALDGSSCTLTFSGVAEIGGAGTNFSGGLTEGATYWLDSAVPGNSVTTVPGFGACDRVTFIALSSTMAYIVPTPVRVRPVLPYTWVTQSSPSLMVGMPVQYTSSGWIPSVNSTVPDADVNGIVTAATGGDTYQITFSGIIYIGGVSSGLYPGTLTPGATYYLGNVASAPALTSTASVTTVLKPVFVALDTVSALIITDPPVNIAPTAIPACQSFSVAGAASAAISNWNKLYFTGYNAAANKKYLTQIDLASGAVSYLDSGSTGSGSGYGIGTKLKITSTGTVTSPYRYYYTTQTGLFYVDLKNPGAGPVAVPGITGDVSAYSVVDFSPNNTAPNYPGLLLVRSGLGNAMLKTLAPKIYTYSGSSYSGATPSTGTMDWSTGPSGLFASIFTGVASASNGVTLFQWNPATRRIYLATGSTTGIFVFSLSSSFTTGNGSLYDWFRNFNSGNATTMWGYLSLSMVTCLSLPAAYLDYQATALSVDFDLDLGSENAVVANQLIAASNSTSAPGNIVRSTWQEPPTLTGAGSTSVTGLYNTGFIPTGGSLSADGSTTGSLIAVGATDENWTLAFASPIPRAPALTPVAALRYVAAPNSISGLSDTTGDRGQANTSDWLIQGMTRRYSTVDSGPTATTPVLETISVNAIGVPIYTDTYNFTTYFTVTGSTSPWPALTAAVRAYSSFSSSPGAAAQVKLNGTVIGTLAWASDSAARGRYAYVASGTVNYSSSAFVPGVNTLVISVPFQKIGGNSNQDQLSMAAAFSSVPAAPSSGNTWWNPGTNPTPPYSYPSAGAVSQWISATPTGACPSGAMLYHFTTTFNVTVANGVHPLVSVNLMCDDGNDSGGQTTNNYGYFWVWVNGTLVVNQQKGYITQFVQFVLNSGFVDGLNTLTVGVIADAGFSGGTPKVGLRAEFSY